LAFFWRRCHHRQRPVRGGTFTYPASLGINGASKGYLERNNTWVNESSVPFTSTSISPAAGLTIRLTRPATGEKTPPIRRQAELAEFGGGAIVESSNLGFAGNGYLRFPGSGYAQWSQVDGLTGGNGTLRLRYANGRTTTWAVHLLINGVTQNITLPPTGSWEKFSLLRVTSPLKSETGNTIRVESVDGAGYIDELQIL
jgi:hypothetical protein